MTEPCHSSTFEKAIAVRQIDKNVYSAHLDPAWCIGKVPHGGYTSSILCRAATTHFAHKTLSPHSRPEKQRSLEPISLQITFQRRTYAGPAIITVQEIKIGARISTIHVTLSQAKDERTATAETEINMLDSSDLEAKVLAYITLAPPELEQGPRVEGPWEGISPAPPAGSLKDGSIDFEALAKNGNDGKWKFTSVPPTLYAAQQVKVYSPSSALLPRTTEERAKQVVDQWAELAPGGTPAQWSNEALVYLADIFPMALDRMGAMETLRAGTANVTAIPSTAQSGPDGVPKDLGLAQFWYPTVTMNIDLKSRLPPEGVKWLYSRVVTRMVRGSRADLEVLILDQDGELVATSTQVALIVDPARNTKGRIGSGKL